MSLLPPPIEATAVWDLLGAVPEQELLDLVGAMSQAEPVALLEAARNLLDRGRDPGAVLQGLAGILRDLVLMAAAPDRPELTSVSPQFRDQLPGLAKSIGRSTLLRWQAQLRGSEQQLRQSVQPRLWLEVLLLGLLAEPVAAPATGTVTAPGSRQPAAVPVAAPAPAPVAARAGPSPGLLHQQQQPRDLSCRAPAHRHQAWPRHQPARAVATDPRQPGTASPGCCCRSRPNWCAWMPTEPWWWWLALDEHGEPPHCWNRPSPPLWAATGNCSKPARVRPQWLVPPQLNGPQVQRPPAPVPQPGATAQPPPAPPCPSSVC